MFVLQIRDVAPDAYTVNLSVLRKDEAVKLLTETACLDPDTTNESRSATLDEISKHCGQ